MLGATSIESETTASASLRAGTAGRRLCGASGLRRGADRRIRSGLRPAFPDNLPRIAIDNQKIAVTDFIVMVSCWRRAGRTDAGYVQRGVIDNEVMQCA